MATVGALTAKVDDDLVPLPKARIKGRQHNAPSFDMRAALYGVLGTDLTQIHGLGPSLTLKLLAFTIGRSHTALSAFYRRLSARTGKQKAVTVTARKIAVLFYNAVRHGMTYQDQGAAAYAERHRQRVLSNLQRRAKTLGYELAPSQMAGGVSWEEEGGYRQKYLGLGRYR